MNKTYSELINEGWIKLPSKFNNIVIAMLNMVEKEMDRCHWNKCHSEFDSPFANTGADPIKTPKFTVRSYDWGVEYIGDQLPNFDTEVMKVFWYKHSNRGLDILVKNEKDMENLPDMLNEYIKSVRIYYGEKDEL